MSKSSEPSSLVRLRRLFRRACADYSLLSDGDRVLVALSGGKDSLVMARLLADQRRILKPRIEVEAAHVIMDNIPYETDRSYLEAYCASLGLPLHILHTSFDDSEAVPSDTLAARRRKTKCFLCSWNRRKALFSFASAEGFNKVALGHHQDDVIVTFLMNLTYEGSLHSITPSMPMRHYPLTVIRPLYLAPEPLIRELAVSLGLAKQKTPCPYETATKRDAMTQVFETLQRHNAEARYSIWSALRGREGGADPHDAD